MWEVCVSDQNHRHPDEGKGWLYLACVPLELSIELKEQGPRTGQS